MLMLASIASIPMDVHKSVPGYIKVQINRFVRSADRPTWQLIPTVIDSQAASPELTLRFSHVIAEDSANNFERAWKMPKIVKTRRLERLLGTSDSRWYPYINHTILH